MGFLRDGAKSMFWHRTKLQPTPHQSTILELVLTVFVIPFKCKQHIIFELRLCRNSSRLSVILRKAMLFCFHLKKPATGCHRLLVDAYGNHTPTIQTVENLFRRFKSGDFGHPWIHGSKVMLCMWWDQKGVINYELLKLVKTITGELYQTQLIRLNATVKGIRPECAERHNRIILQQDNARPHIAKVVKM